MAQGMVLPGVRQVREVAQHVAAAVAQSAITDGIARNNLSGDLVAHMAALQYTPQYHPIINDVFA
jgi:malic enzyme